MPQGSKCAGGLSVLAYLNSPGVKVCPKALEYILCHMTAGVQECQESKYARGANVLRGSQGSKCARRFPKPSMTQCLRGLGVSGGQV